MTPPARNRRPTPLRLLVRTVWVAGAILAMGSFLTGLLPYFSELRTVCIHGAQRCVEGTLSTPGQGLKLRELGLSVGFYAAYNVALSLVFASAWWLTGLFIFWRRSEDRMALLAATMLVTFPIFFLAPLQALVDAYPSWRSLAWLLTFLGFASTILFFYTFPNGRFVPRWTAIPALVWIANDGVSTLLPGWYAAAGSGWLGTVGFLAFLVPALCAVFSQVYRYRRASDAVQRQQTKWVVFGVVLGFGGFVVLVLVQGAIFGFEEARVVSLMISEALTTILLVGIPLSIGLAILRSGLWDVDFIINRALVYGSLTVTLLGLYFGVVVVLQRLFVLLTGEQSTLAVVASTLAIAVLFAPLRRRVQGFVDRRFYRRKYDAAKTLEAFSTRLREEIDLGTLADDLVGIVNETMQPSHVSLWLRPGLAPRRIKEE